MNRNEIIMKGLQADSMGFYNMYGASAMGANGEPSAEEIASVLMLLQQMGFDGTTAMGFNADAQNFNADAMNFSMNPVFAKQATGAAQVRAMLASQVESGAMTIFSMRAVYVPGPGPAHAPVTATFFRMNFNPGVFLPGGSMQFTNALGDTVVVTGITENLETYYDMTKTEPFKLAYVRAIPKTQTQFDYKIRILKNTQYDSGSFNSLEPRIYKDPYQFAQLEVDIPFNMQMNRKEGWSWDFDEDQTGTGCSIALFISQTLDPTKILEGKDQIRNLNGGATNNFFTPNAPASQIRNAIMTKEMGNLAKNPIMRGMAKNMMERNR